MINKILTTFIRNNIEGNADLGEKIGNVGLGLLRIGFGKTLIIEKISNGVDGIAFTEKAYSTSARVAAIALFIFALPVTITLACIGYAGTIFSKSHKQIFNSYNQSKLFSTTTVQNSIKQDILPITDLWPHLEKKTQAELQRLEFLSIDVPKHRFFDIRCPRKTALAISGRYLHANKVGEGVAERSFVASQAPLLEDYETFWKAILEHNPTIFDLTTIQDQIDGGVTKYYPERLNQTIRCGSMLVKLVKVSDRTHTYQMENIQTRVVKNIKRFHYADWKDLGAVSLPALHLLVQEVETLSPNPKDLLWIHCRAGVGRTGTLITALVLKEKIKSGEIHIGNLDASLVDIIVELRKQRGPVFVQQIGQLDLLRQYADSLLKN
jgi:protein tyrosine phosphatase